MTTHTAPSTVTPGETAADHPTQLAVGRPAVRCVLRLPVDDSPVCLDDVDPGSTPRAPRRSVAVEELHRDLRPRLERAHEWLMAHERRAVVLILQGLDASGKSGTIKHVVSAMNPVGVRVATFKEPEGVERHEHFLARIERSLPALGELAVFDRSHYEDLIVPLADGAPDDVVDRRVAEIRAFESALVASGTVVVKCALHISYDEQRERFLRRLRRDDKRWKFSQGDLETRRRWPEFVDAYAETLRRTSIEDAPWHLVPADRKWYRNWAIAHILVDVLEHLHDGYPTVELDVDAVADQLRPPS